ncbi:pyridoxal phosphate-dependent aminotransferase family protein [Flammeovirga sp. EKP202]|uniref:aminotransferase class I/II-fold pyridoxal phosphate-dependent enzyme n=1 Tax=Flammeovirga sp. EKP202 TaxID=2770592 RepID=UPI00165FC492|nr:pyridoxal phosphate-dependent aminotransferase family protein [Flammeovirga sp. EKP202]MBD0402731.1 pyridoxal phosphate-dependent aminotransferase family protein [Flammeovirga sp. EKP202]
MELSQQLSAFKETHQYRSLKEIDRKDGGHVQFQGKDFISFTSNDYLGIASDKGLQEAFLKENQADFFSFGSASSRLLEGHSSICTQLENTIASSYGKEACLWMNSGYHANIGLMSSLPQKGDLILSDKLNHASIVDGLKLAKAQFERFRHLDYDHLERLLKKHRENFNKVFIVSEALFSMDGDCCDVKKLVALKQKYSCHLIIDEAHSVGAFGENGLGLCEAEGKIEDIDVIVAPCGKALGAVGAFVVLSAEWKEYLINTCRSFIYTTALPPINTAWLLFTWKKIQKAGTLRSQLENNTNYFIQKAKESGIDTVSTTYIQPIIIGDNKDCLALTEALNQEEIIVSAIRYPTVPKGTARLRLSITSNHTKEEIDKVLDMINHYKKSETHADTLVK